MTGERLTGAQAKRIGDLCYAHQIEAVVVKRQSDGMVAVREPDRQALLGLVYPNGAFDRWNEPTRQGASR